MTAGAGAGADVRVVTTKWGDRPHWEFDAVVLGEDEHGTWLGITRGALMARPGASFTTETHQVGLVPRDQWWLATFHAPGYEVATYVDMTTVPSWSDDSAGRAVVTAVDLDLDVIRRADGTVFVDDEDEFAEHQLGYGYPPEVIAGAEASAAWVLDAVRRRTAPFDGSHLPWLDQVGGA